MIHTHYIRLDLTNNFSAYTCSAYKMKMKEQTITKHFICKSNFWSSNFKSIFSDKTVIYYLFFSLTKSHFFFILLS